MNTHEGGSDEKSLCMSEASVPSEAAYQSFVGSLQGKVKNGGAASVVPTDTKPSVQEGYEEMEQGEKEPSIVISEKSKDCIPYDDNGDGDGETTCLASYNDLITSDDQSVGNGSDVSSVTAPPTEIDVNRTGRKARSQTREGLGYITEEDDQEKDEDWDPKNNSYDIDDDDAHPQEAGEATVESRGGMGDCAVESTNQVEATGRKDAEQAEERMHRNRTEKNRVHQVELTKLSTEGMGAFDGILYVKADQHFHLCFQGGGGFSLDHLFGMGLDQLATFHRVVEWHRKGKIAQQVDNKIAFFCGKAKKHFLNLFAQRYAALTDDYGRDVPKLHTSVLTLLCSEELGRYLPLIYDTNNFAEFKDKTRDAKTSSKTLSRYENGRYFVLIYDEAFANFKDKARDAKTSSKTDWGMYGRFVMFLVHGFDYKYDKNFSRTQVREIALFLAKSEKREVQAPLKKLIESEEWYKHAPKRKEGTKKSVLEVLWKAVPNVRNLSPEDKEILEEWRRGRQTQC